MSAQSARVRLLFDQNVPRPLKDHLFGHDVVRLSELGWSELRNGQLLDAAESGGFDVLLTGDRNMRHQQHLAGRTIALVVLSTNNWNHMHAEAASVQAALGQVRPGAIIEVAFRRPPLRRRPPPAE